jgi:threonylcarbamoyladenosine tRNA methylthiotransferase MtaB
MKVYLDTIGCRLNQSELETFARQFRQAGHTVVSEPGEADLIVVNTCAVTAEAAADSRQKIRHAARASGGEVIVTGCWATLNPQAAEALPGVKRVVPNAAKDALVADALGVPPEEFDLEPLARQPLPGLRQRTRAFIKVQDGCNNHCTFCITTLARGDARSREIHAVIEDVQLAISGGAKEIVLTGVHLGSWGYDLERGLHLRQLVQAILDQTDVGRLRLSSLEPWDLDEEFFSLWRDGRMCRHLHLPLQSGSGTILRRMARKVTPESFRRLVGQARGAIPELAITTDVIVGFPGEGDAEFDEGIQFIREMGFAGGHVFTYSARPGTAAASFPGQVGQEIRKARNAILRAEFAEASRHYRERFVGQEVEVLWEASPARGPEGWLLNGLTDTYLRVTAPSAELMWNEISRVRLEGLTDEGLSGVIISSQMVP